MQTQHYMTPEFRRKFALKLTVSRGSRIWQGISENNMHYEY
jgi:hypothetical protein